MGNLLKINQNTKMKKAILMALLGATKAQSWYYYSDYWYDDYWYDDYWYDDWYYDDWGYDYWYDDWGTEDWYYDDWGQDYWYDDWYNDWYDDYWYDWDDDYWYDDWYWYDDYWYDDYWYDDWYWYDDYWYDDWYNDWYYDDWYWYYDDWYYESEPDIGEMIANAANGVVGKWLGCDSNADCFLEHGPDMASCGWVEQEFVPYIEEREPTQAEIDQQWADCAAGAAACPDDTTAGA